MVNEALEGVFPMAHAPHGLAAFDEKLGEVRANEVFHPQGVLRTTRPACRQGHPAG